MIIGRTGGRAEIIGSPAVQTAGDPIIGAAADPQSGATAEIHVGAQIIAAGARTEMSDHVTVHTVQIEAVTVEVTAEIGTLGTLGMTEIHVPLETGEIPDPDRIEAAPATEEMTGGAAEILTGGVPLTGTATGQTATWRKELTVPEIMILRRRRDA